MNKIEHSYARHAVSEQQTSMPSCYLEPGSVDNWRHQRMLELTRSIWRLLPKSKWITVGDGRYGSDANFLYANGIDVIATSLTDEHLKYAKDKGFIPAFCAENAERISMEDNSVDFVLCKEAYHHFPRPPIALYEMLRVARIAVVLIEPIDNPRLLDGLKQIIKRVLRGDREIQFETSGNFLYRLNLRELEKLMTAMGAEDVLFKGINDFFHPRLSKYKKNEFNLGFVLTKFGIFLQNVFSRLGLLGYGLACVVVFKQGAGSEIIACLKGSGFTHVELPKNPYVNSAAE